VGGYFTTIGGQARNRVAALNAASGIPTSWNPGAAGTFLFPAVYALAATSTAVYAGGYFTSVGGLPQSYIAAMDAVDACSLVTCTSLDQCHVAGTCDPGTGLCSNPNAADGTLCTDGNACTSGDACTGGTCSGTPVEPPPEVGNTLLVTQSGAASVISWSDDGNPGTFRLYRGTRSPVASWSYNQQCLGGPIMGTSATDTDSPAPASTFFYLVTRTTPCGESIAGRNSEGEAVPNPNSCP